MINEETIKKKICEMHDGDIQQLNVIFSNSNRVLVEAPAGYGKTTTMISRIAYLYVSGKIPNPKKVLGLTFSVNAALKVKRDVSAKLPEILGEKDNPVTIGESICVTNYHGFCKGVLKKYGHLINPLLRRDINTLYAIGENEIQKDSTINRMLSNDEKEFLLRVESMNKSIHTPSKAEIEEYNAIVCQKLLPQNIITHTSIILLTLQLFDNYKTIQSFYKSYYPLIIVDEFQDTNSISWELLQKLISENTQLLFLGDSLQRIYGFIGAVPHIMDKAKEAYKMESISLNRNYRFSNNAEMLKLDTNVRLNASTHFSNQKLEEATIQTLFFNSHEEESQHIVKLVRELQEDDFDTKVAILFRSRGKDVELLQNELDRSGIQYFFGMFSDDDDEYIQFHIVCRDKLITMFGSKKYVNIRGLQKYIKDVESVYADRSSQIIQSLIVLLKATIEKLKTDYNTLLPEEKYEFLLDTFENNQLKQAMEYVNSNVIISTIHGSKGLEWNYVILADLEQWIFPGYALCSNCTNRLSSNSTCCSIPSEFSEDFLNLMLDELSVFYVAVTRARKEVFFAASLTRYNSLGERKRSKLSCLGRLPGIKLINFKFGS